jgi:hypothetical protein
LQRQSGRRIFVIALRLSSSVKDVQNIDKFVVFARLFLVLLISCFILFRVLWCKVLVFV